MNGTRTRAPLRLLAVLVLLAGACRGAPDDRLTDGRRSAASPAASIAITDVTVVDVVTGRRQSGMTVLTGVGDIVEIGRGVSVPPGAKAVDGTGKFLIPGLWDMHHQGTGAESVDLFVANGVVGTRDMVRMSIVFFSPFRTCSRVSRCYTQNMPAMCFSKRVEANPRAALGPSFSRSARGRACRLPSGHVSIVLCEFADV
jgi:hypothetical protein